MTALYWAIPNYRDFDFKEQIVYGDPVAAADLGWASLYAAVYTTLALGLALLVFRRRDLQ